MNHSLIQVLMLRDNLSRDEAQELIYSAHYEVVDEGLEPDEVLRDNFGLEPDYIFDLLDPSTMVGWYHDE